MVKAELKMNYPAELVLTASYTIDHHEELAKLEKFVELAKESDHHVGVGITYDGMGTITVCFDLGIEEHESEPAMVLPEVKKPPASVVSGCFDKFLADLVAPVPAEAAATVDQITAQHVFAAGIGFAARALAPEHDNPEKLFVDVSHLDQRLPEIEADAPNFDTFPAPPPTDPSAADLDQAAADPTTAPRPVPSSGPELVKE